MSRLRRAHTEALGIINKAGDETKYRSAAAKFKSISGFKDADALAAQCLEKAELAHKEAEERRIAEEKAAEERRIAEEKAAEERRRDSVYAKASALAVKQDIPSVEQAIEKFQSISGWKDSNAQIELCRKKIEEIKAKEEADRQEAERQRMIREREEKLKKEKNKKIGIICGIAAVVVIAAVIVLTTVVIPNNKYKTATELLSAGNYDEAYQILVDIKNNKNAKASLCNIADEMIGDNRYDEAIDILNIIPPSNLLGGISSTEYSYMVQGVVFRLSHILPDYFSLRRK